MYAKGKLNDSAGVYRVCVRVFVLLNIYIESARRAVLITVLQIRALKAGMLPRHVVPNVDTLQHCESLGVIPVITLGLNTLLVE